MAILVAVLLIQVTPDGSTSGSVTAKCASIIFGIPTAEAKARPNARRAQISRRNGGWTTPKKRRAFDIEMALERARSRTVPAAKAKRPDGLIPAAIPSPVTAEGARAAEAEAAAPMPTAKEMRDAVLATPVEDLKRVGRHLIVGYHNAGQLTPLLERGAIGGVFVTARNARGRTLAKLSAEIAQLRALAAAAGQKPFWISTDQEGGGVSRLSPPLPRQPSLPRLIRDLKTPQARVAAVADFAMKQGQALAAIGVNLNFAPVADLNLDARHARDLHTRLRHRSVSSDPLIVADIARTYCTHLLANAVACTLKHFPGLGRILADTHITAATLKTPRDVLEGSDWVPFQRVLDTTPAFLMVGHPHLASVDTDDVRPASTSRAVIDGVIRKSLKFNGVVITDDLAMGAIRRRTGGMPRAAVEAMAAGADLILVGLDGDQIYPVLYAMLEAVRKGQVTAAQLRSSQERLERMAETTETSGAIARRDEVANSGPKASELELPELGRSRPAVARP
ncbi:MAG: glycoside hydrolase family 3 N-terminal domain-containing protein [Hyphomicrobiaceae bacterium]